MTQEETAIVEAQPSANIPMMTPEEAKIWWDGFLKLKKMLLTETDYMKDKQGRTYIRKSGFRKLMYAFGLSDKITDEERVERADGTFYWRVIVQVCTASGRCATGAAICDSQEKVNKSLPGQLEHNTYTMAHTRAKNRAASDLIAGGEVSAEEMDFSDTKDVPVEVQPSAAQKSSPKISPKKPNSEERVFSFKGSEPDGGFK